MTEKFNNDSLSYLRSIQSHLVGNIEATDVGLLLNSSHERSDGALSWLKHPASYRSVFAKYGALQARDLIFLQNFASDLGGRELKVIRETYFTEYEDYFSSAILWLASQKAKEALAFLELSPPNEVVLGTLPIGAVNAQLFKSPSGDNIIAFNAALIPFIYCMAKAVAFCFNFQETEEGTLGISLSCDNIEASISPAISADVLRTLRSYLLSGYIEDALDNIVDYVDSPSFQYIKQLCTSAFLFMVAHEYAHIAIDELAGVAESLSITSLDYSAPTNWKTEFHADEIALAVCRYTNSAEDVLKILFNFVGIDFFFSSLGMVNSILGIEDSETHPSLQKRKARIQLLVKSVGLPDEVYESIVMLSKKNTLILRALLDSVLPEISSEMKDLAKRGFV